MKNLMLIILCYISANMALAADKTIICSNGTCTTNFVPTQILEKPTYTALTVGENSDHINVSVPSGGDPRSIRLSVNNRSFPGKNLILDLSSGKPTANSGSAIIVGDTFSNITMKLNGYNGSKGRDVSELCAEKMKNGNYGEAAKNFFITRRQSQEGLSPNRCDRTDLTYLQSYGFTCDDDSYHQVFGLNPVLDVKRLKTKARCNGVLVQDMCLKRKVVATCSWRPYWVDCSKKGGCTSGWSGDPITYSKKMAEEEYLYKTNTMGQQQFCASEMGVPGGQIKFYGYGAYLTTPGVNPANYLPLAGSDWELYYTDAYGHCQTFWTTVRTIYTIVNAYDETGTDCSDVGVSEDPNHLIPWTYNGMAQEASFGPELLHCSIGECPVQSTLSDLSRSIDQLTPESGSSGTQQGMGMVFAYEISNSQTQANIGQAGAAGQIDLDTISSTNYCAKVRDYDSDGASSDYAKNPNVSFRRYNWQAIKTSSGGNTGTQPIQNGNSIIIFKKLDSSVRYYLSKQLL